MWLCVSLIGVNWNWEALSAVATTFAAVVALVLGVYNLVLVNRSTKHERTERMMDLSIRLYAACEHYVLAAGRFRDQAEWMSEVNSLAYALEAYGWKRPDEDSLDYRGSLRELMKRLADIKR